MLLLISILPILAAAMALYFYLTWNFDHWQKRRIPGPKPKILLGTFPGTITGKRNIIYDLDEVYCEFRRQARFVGVFTTRNPQLMILDPALAKEVLITNFRCFQENEASKWVNNNSANPFVLPAGSWKIKRGEVVPGLTLSKVKGMHPIIENTCDKLRKYLTTRLETGTLVFDAKDFSLRFTAEVVADVVWGFEAGTFHHASDTKKPLDCAFLNMSERLIAHDLHAFKYFFIIGMFPPLRHLFDLRFFSEITDRFFLNLTKMACNMRNSVATAQHERQDFLQHLVELQQKKHLSVDEVLAHMLTFHFDGFETSATVISHCLLLLARHPAVQQKLRREIMEAISACNDDGHDNDDGHRIPFDELMKLDYLEQCVAETLRIFAPLPFMSKMCTEPCVLENGDGVRLQLHTSDVCLISLHSFHHDEDYYTQPERFMPERFSNENGGTKKYKDMGVYLPFGDGPRICLGMKFALAQVKAAVVEVITNFEVSVNERTRTDNWQGASGFITGLEGGVHLELKAIKK